MSNNDLFTFPPIVEKTLPEGLEVLLAPHHEQPGLIAALQLPLGRFSDPAGYEGLTELTVALMQKGTQTLGSEEFAERLENMGYSLFSEVGEEHVTIGCKGLARYADEVLPLFWDMIRKPALLKSELGRLKREMSTALRAESTEPSSLASKHFYSQLFGKLHPAGRVHTVESVNRIQIDDVRRRYESAFGPRGATLVVAGDFDLDSVDSDPRWPDMLTWDKETHLQAVELPRPGTEVETVVRLVDKPDLTQATIILGNSVPGEVHPDRKELALANYVLGGGNFSSRLMREVRSRMGKTYGISSQISTCRDIGVFTISTSTQNPFVEEMLRTIFEVYTAFAAEGIGEEEFADAKRYAVGSMAFQLEGLGNIVDKLLWLRLYGRDKSYIEQFAASIQQIDLERTISAIRRHFAGPPPLVVAVGNRKQIETQLRGFGEVRVRHYRSRL